MSAEGIEYHPPVGTHNKKILLLEDFDERGGDRISSPLRGRTTKKSSCWRISMSAEGIEPSTNSLKGCCSAIELRARDV